MTALAHTANPIFEYERLRGRFGRNSGQVLTYVQSQGSGEELESSSECGTWFFKLWERASSQNSESVWKMLPEAVVDAIDEGETWSLDEAGLRFLEANALSPNTHTTEAVAAIRLLGLLAEDGHISTDKVADTLRDALVVEDVQRRYFAVEALWQGRVIECISSLKRLVTTSDDDQLCDLATRAIAVLER